MAIVRMPWFAMGTIVQGWVEWEDSDRLIRTVIVRNESGVPIQYTITDSDTDAVLIQGTVQSQAGEQRFNIPTPQRRDIDSIDLSTWW